MAVLGGCGVGAACADLKAGLRLALAGVAARIVSSAGVAERR
ncbi:hypothetical protein LG3211_4380 [Lysobacter gummosus]|nr:hypothetical protein LG3211_4380 [Lysobacter gummosus]